MTTLTTSPPDTINWSLRARQMRQRQLRGLAQLGALVSCISSLVHMLQCERGASNIWLCSQGQLYVAESRASRALVDEHLSEFHRALAPLSAVCGSALCERIAAALEVLALLKTLREAIVSRSITAHLAMEQYSRVVRQLLSIVPQLNDSIDDAHIAGRFVALYSLMQGKELVGQERALGAMGFTEGNFSESMRQTLVDRIDAQQACFEVYLSRAQDEVKLAWNASCLPEGAIETLRRIACTRQPTADRGATALRWFTLQTTRLEHLRALEETATADLMAAVHERLQAQEGGITPCGDDAFFAYPDKPLLPLVREQAREIEQLSRQLASLRDTLEARKTIDKAKSVLMTHHGMTEEQAWVALRKMAMDKNQRMVDIAQALLTVKSLWQITPKE